MPLPHNMKVQGDAYSDYPAVVYSKARAKWLEAAAVMAFEAQGDDEWLDWVSAGKELTKKGE